MTPLRAHTAALWRSIACAGCLVVASGSPAQVATSDNIDSGALASPASRATLSEDGPEYGGVVTNQTLTGSGHLFHATFTQAWNALGDADSHVLLVRERPSPRGGTEIQVLSNDTMVFRSGLPRSAPAIASLSEAAVEQVRKNLEQQTLQSLLFNDPDLARPSYR